MTTKAKTGKTRKPAAKASAPKPAPATSENPREVSEIRTLVSRWRWLEADQEYQAQTATTEDESEKLIAIHYGEQEKIEGALAALVPESMLDVTCLLEFATDRAQQGGCMALDAEIDMFRNIRANVWDILSAEMDKACKEAVEKAEAKMRDRVRWEIETKEWREAQIQEARMASRKAA